MVSEVQKIVKAAVAEFVSQPDFNLKKKPSGQREPEGEQSDAASVWKDKYFRLLADLENTKKRRARVAAVEIEGQTIELLKDMLQVADGLDLLLNHMSGEDGGSRDIFIGIKGLKDIFDKLFSKYDVKTIDALGAVFDPNLHEALGMIRNPAAMAHTVVRVEKKDIYITTNCCARPR